jgi:7-cyano-7-deazaguanine synthase in queuosine biosynthesis
MTWHVYPTIGRRDSFRPAPIHSDDSELRIPIESSGVPHEVSTHLVWRTIDTHHLKVGEVATELYRLAVAVYTADLRIPRKSGFDRWTRDILLHVPVSDPDHWQNAAKPLEEFLSFLTGDHWTVKLRKHNAPRPPIEDKFWKQSKSLKSTTVSLFSGGLDSFIGALDGLADGEHMALVGHYHEATPEQRVLFQVLAQKYPPEQLYLLQFYISPQKALTGEVENTQRSRSFLFLSLGVLVAAALGEDTPLSIPENGFISLNVPLTGTRLGSLSTRTTHPHTLFLFGDVLRKLGIGSSIEMPYRFQTKGEMISQCRDQTLLREYIRTTISCAHPGQGRWTKGNPRQHCGYCVPCLIRRAAMHREGLDSSDDYAYDVLQAPPPGARSSDLRAFLIALEHGKERSSTSSVLRAGPLPASPVEIGQYVGVYERGLEEVAEFFGNRRWKNL